MGSDIEWTDETWNPTVGCSRVSPGCDGCYAIGVAHRAMQPAHAGLTERLDDGNEGQFTDWTGEVRLLPDRLDAPLRWRKPRRVFVDSMSDLFHPEVPEQFVTEVFATMALTPRHTFQVLTKRPQRMAELVSRAWDGMSIESPPRVPIYPPGETWPLPNAWLGTSVENQRYADLRIPYLAATPAAVRFLSIEPLLGPVNIGPWVGEGPDAPRALDWVIVGGESGPGARPMHPQWVRDLRDQCVAADVPFFFKQWGEWLAVNEVEVPALAVPGAERGAPSVSADFRRVGKKAAGRMLDGRTWDEYPETI